MAKKIDYSRELAYQKVPKHEKEQVARHRAERAYKRKTGHGIPAGFELDHKKALSVGGSLTEKVRLIPRKQNRGYPRDRNNKPTGPA